MMTSHSSIAELDASQARVRSSTAIYDIFSGMSRACVIAAVVAAPWFFGGVATDVQFWLYASILAGLAIWIPGAIWQSFTNGLNTNRLPWVFVPLIGCLGLGAEQLWLQLPAVSPEKIQADFESATNSSEDEVQRRELGKASMIRSLQTGKSICPAATRFEMAKLIMVVAAFFLGTQLFVTERTGPLLWMVLALNGAALSFFGICQALSWNGKIYWTVPLRYGGYPFASYVNRNNAAGYLCICLAAALGLAVWAFLPAIGPISIVPKTKKRSLHRADERHHGAYPSLLRTNFLSRLSVVHLAAATFVILIAAGIVLAASRGGWLALAVATVATVFVGLLSTRFRGASVIGYVFIIGLLISTFVSWAGFGDRIVRRWEDFVSFDALSKDGRWGHWQDAFKAVSDFPVWGTGYGTYQFAYLPYQSRASNSSLRYFHADNQFLEWLVEGGFTGISLILLLILFTLGTIAALLRRPRLDPVAVVGVFALVSQCVSAFFDYGPTMSANMLTLATLFGAITGRAPLLVNTLQMEPRFGGFSFPAFYPSVLMPVTGLAILALGVVGLREVRAASQPHYISRSLPKLNLPNALDEDLVSQKIDEISRSLLEYPDDPDVHFALAELFVYRFRLQEFQIATKSQDLRPQLELWNQTNPAVFYRQVNLWQRTGQVERIDLLIQMPTIQANLVPAFNHLRASQSACALMPDVSQRLAVLAFVVGPDSATGEGELRRAIVVEPSSPETFFQVGQIADFAELTFFSFACWKKSLELAPQYLLEIHQSVSGRLSLDEEFEQVVPKSNEMMIQLAQLVTGTDAQRLSHDLANRVLKSLSENQEQMADGERLRLLGKAHDLLGEGDLAIDDYRKALDLSPLQIEWRMELIDLLLKRKGPVWALRESEVCLTFAPDNKHVQLLVQNLRARLAH